MSVKVVKSYGLKKIDVEKIMISKNVKKRFRSHLRLLFDFCFHISCVLGDIFHIISIKQEKKNIFQKWHFYSVVG